jgi:hypothetical protein
MRAFPAHETRIFDLRGFRENGKYWLNFVVALLRQAGILSGYFGKSIAHNS